MSKHENNGHCLRCAEIFDRYPDFDVTVRNWFESLQDSHPEAHISCAGRGKSEQEELFHRGASKANWGQSAHNYNAAIDVFAIIPGEKTIYPLGWFHSVLSSALTENLNWYGRPGCPFPEMPHVELKSWHLLAGQNLIQLVSSY